MRKFPRVSPISTVLALSIFLVLVSINFLADGITSEDKDVPFPDGYLENKNRSFSFFGHYGSFTRDLFYDLIIDGIFEHIIIRNWNLDAVTREPTFGMKYAKIFRGKSVDECQRAGQRESVPSLKPLRLFGSFASRQPFDLMRGKCVLLKLVDNAETDLTLVENNKSWTFVDRVSEKRVARAPVTQRHRAVRALFGEHLNASQHIGSSVYDDNFDDAALVDAIKRKGPVRSAALFIIRRRSKARYDIVSPDIEVRRSISRDVVDALLGSFVPRSESSVGFPVGFGVLRSGATPETADVIYPKMIEMLYAPFLPSGPLGLGEYDHWWKVQIRKNRPELEGSYVANGFIPRFAAGTNRASALVLMLGSPYVERFYKEFKADLEISVLRNNNPSFDTTVVALAAQDPERIIRKIQGLRLLSPIRMAKIWAFIHQSEYLSNDFIQGLQSNCESDPNYLNNKLASKKYLNGIPFCEHFLDDN